MRALVVYESQLGTTRQAATAVARGMSAAGAVVTLEARSEVTAGDLDRAEILVVGAPVRIASTDDHEVHHWLRQVPDGRGRPVAVYETCVATPDSGVMARRLEHELTERGWSVVVPPIAFVAAGVDAPLVWGEQGHASAWGAQIVHYAGQAAATNERTPRGTGSSRRPHRAHQPRTQSASRNP